MKKILIAFLLTAFTSVITAQTTVLNPNPFPKTITVSGSAEMEIIPDEIYVNITLREYQKRGEDKKEIETIKTNFLESCRLAGIPDSLISIYSYTGYNNYYFLGGSATWANIRGLLTNNINGLHLYEEQDFALTL